MNMSKHCVTLFIIFSICLYPTLSTALFQDKEGGRWNLLGQFKTQATFRTETVPPNSPIPIEAGDMTSQRNLIMLEWKHNLGEPLFGIQTEYQLRGRAYYDGAWDYGPDVMSDDDTRDLYCLDNRDEIDDEKWDAEMFHAYLDLTKSHLFLRLGRQVMSWGEMSTIRILDGTNPMNTSSLAVDMSERLIPLWMARVNLAFESVGPLDSFSFGGYFVPGKIDNTYEEKILDGSPIVPTIGRDLISDLEDPFSLASLKESMVQEDSEIDEDRFGIKLGMLIKGLDFNFTYYRMYSEIPIPRINMDTLEPITVDMMTVDLDDPLKSILGDQKLRVDLERDTVDVYGTSFNYNISAINTILRGEAAYFEDVPKMTPGYIDSMVGALSTKVTVVRIKADLEELMDLFPLGRMASMTLPFTVGDIAKYDVVKYGVGLDKWVNLPWLNTEDFLFTVEYVGSKVLGYKKHTIMQLWHAAWDDDRDGHYDTVWESEYSNTFIIIGRTNYLNGNLTPQLVTMYEVEPQALVLMPSIRYSWHKFDFELSCFFTESNGYEGTLGMLDKRDEITFSITYVY